MRFQTHLFWGSVLTGLAITASVSAQSDLPVYTDSLANGFQVWNSAAHSLTNTAPVHWGAHSIRVDAAAAWEGLSFYHSELDTTPFSSLSFWVHGGANGGQRLQVQAKVGPANPPADVYYRFTVPADAWQLITVPLTALGAADKTNLTGVWIQLTPGGATNTFYVDDVQFNPRAVALASINAALPVAAPVAPAEPKSGGRLVAWGIVGALGVIIGLLGWLVAMLRKSGLGKSRALALAAAGEVVPVANLAPGQIDWRYTAAGKAGPELTEFAKEALVQGLYTQRSALIETQRRAQEELTELEGRLAKLQLPLAERIQAYEKRIAELEKELNTRGEEMKELTRATLLLVRQKLGEEKELEQSTRLN